MSLLGWGYCRRDYRYAAVQRIPASMVAHKKIRPYHNGSFHTLRLINLAIGDNPLLPFAAWLLSSLHGVESQSESETHLLG